MGKIFVIICLILSALVYTGCKRTSIQFNRESSAAKVLNAINQNSPKKDVLKKSSGIIIYKDNSSTDKNKNYKNPQFGPKDLDFDIKIK